MDTPRASRIVSSLISAADLFAAQNPYPDQGRQSSSVWWHSVPRAAALLESAVEDLVRANQSQLSHSDTARTLTYQTFPSLSTLALGERVDRVALEASLAAAVVSLASARSSRRLQFVVENIGVDGDVPGFLGVRLVRPSQDEIQELYDDPLIRNPHTNALAFAEVEAPGDDNTAYEWGVSRVERFLSLLQGCGIELMLGSFLPVHIIDRNPVVENTAVRQRDGGRYRTSVRIQYGGSLRVASVRANLLSLFTPRQIDCLVTASTRPSSEMQSAVVACLETLGEACKPHLNHTRLLLISTALEMLVGARESDDVSFRGLTAAIAERSTFLVGGASTSDRLAFDRRVRKLYGKGSSVRHGRRPDVSSDEIRELASITRRVAGALLDRSELVKTTKDLDNWVQEMRYTTAPES